MCIRMGRGAFGYPGKSIHAIWSMVMARIAISLTWFAFNVFLLFT